MTIRLHDVHISGHCYRVRLLLALLDIPYELVPVDLLNGEHKGEKFLKLNTFGQIPVLEDGEIVVADSNAVLVYLVEKYAAKEWYASTPQGKAEIQRWLSVAAGPLAFYPAASRIANLFKRPLDPQTITQAHALLEVIDRTLQTRSFLAGSSATIADLAIYSYVVVAPEGNVSLDRYAAIRRWLGRIEALPRFVAMPRTAVGLSA